MCQMIVSPYGIFLSALLAFIPLLWLLVSLGVFNLPAYKACITGLILSLIIAVGAWHMPVVLSLKAALEGAVLALWPIIWVILAAIFTYNVTLKTGAMDKIKALMASISGDRRIQALIIAWGFGGFLEAAAGFGTAVAIPASILIGLGFDPFFAAVICLIANTVPVAFGAVGIPVTTLAKVSDLDVMYLTYNIALQLTPFVAVIPILLVLLMTKKVSGIRGVWGTALVAGISFAVLQLLIAKFVGPELTAIVGSIVSMAATALWAKISPPASEWRFPHEQSAARPAATLTQENTVFDYDADTTSLSQQLVAWAPYILLFVLILGTSKFNPALNDILSAIKTNLPIYDGPGGKPLTIDWIVTPGTMIMIAAIVGGLIQGASLSALIAIFGQTVVQLQKTIITVVSIVSMAKVMGYSGMISAIAIPLAQLTGKFYPVIAPLIGALGTFVTGSDTSANVLFGQLQKQTALQIGTNPVWITASNTSGATAGKMISPQSIAVAASATGLTGREGEIMKETMKYCLAYVLILGVLVYFFA